MLPMPRGASAGGLHAIEVLASRGSHAEFAVFRARLPAVCCGCTSGFDAQGPSMV